MFINTRYVLDENDSDLFLAEQGLNATVIEFPNRELVNKSAVPGCAKIDCLEWNFNRGLY